MSATILDRAVMCMVSQDDVAIFVIRVVQYGGRHSALLYWDFVRVIKILLTDEVVHLKLMEVATRGASRGGRALSRDPTVELGFYLFGLHHVSSFAMLLYYCCERAAVVA